MAKLSSVSHNKTCLKQILACAIDQDVLDKYGHCPAWINVNGYVVVKFDGKEQYLHRLIINARPGEICDHINRVRTDNRRSNLRLASKHLNNFNSGVKRTNKLGIKGVVYDAARGKFAAYVTFGGKSMNQGYYKTAEEAQAAYDKVKSILGALVK